MVDENLPKTLQGVSFINPNAAPTSSWRRLLGLMGLTACDRVPAADVWRRPVRVRDWVAEQLLDGNLDTDPPDLDVDEIADTLKLKETAAKKTRLSAQQGKALAVLLSKRGQFVTEAYIPGGRQSVDRLRVKGHKILNGEQAVAAGVSKTKEKGFMLVDLLSGGQGGPDFPKT